MLLIHCNLCKCERGRKRQRHKGSTSNEDEPCLILPSLLQCWSVHKHSYLSCNGFLDPDFCSFRHRWLMTSSTSRLSYVPWVYVSRLMYTSPILMREHCWNITNRIDSLCNIICILWRRRRRRRRKRTLEKNHQALTTSHYRPVLNNINKDLVEKGIKVVPCDGLMVLGVIYPAGRIHNVGNWKAGSRLARTGSCYGCKWEDKATDGGDASI